jgi:hypothetical protein
VEYLGAAEPLQTGDESTNVVVPGLVVFLSSNMLFSNQFHAVAEIFKIIPKKKPVE